MRNLGLYVLMALGVLAFLDILVIVRGRADKRVNWLYFVSWLIVLLVFIACIIMGMGYTS